jgi:hypothetical protein
VQTLSYCVLAYLKFRLNQLRNRKITPRQCIKSLEATLKVVLSRDANFARDKFQIDLGNLFPKEELKRGRDLAIKNFVNKRLPSQDL